MRTSFLPLNVPSMTKRSESRRLEDEIDCSGSNSFPSLLASDATILRNLGKSRSRSDSSKLDVSSEQNAKFSEPKTKN